MLTNTDATVYVRTDHGFVRKYIPECNWQAVDSSTLTTTGKVKQDGVNLYIPAQFAHCAPMTAGDIVVKGKCTLMDTDGSAAGQSAFEKRLRKQKDIHTIKSVEDKMYGLRLKHIKVVMG